MNYRILDTVLHTAMQLPELHSAESLAPGINVKKLCKQQIIGHPDWLHHWLDEGEVAISTGYVKDNYLIRFPDLADFVIDKACSTIDYRGMPELEHMTLHHLLLDQVIPRVRGQQGQLVVHASAVTLNSGKTILFVGESGSGKSTLAATCAEFGAQVIADDCVLIRMGNQAAECFGNYPSLRLYAESAQACKTPVSQDNWSDNTQKFHISLKLSDSRDKNRPTSIDAIFLLKPSTSEANCQLIRPAAGAEMLVAIIHQLFLVNPLDTNLSSSHFRQLSDLVNQGLPVFSIEFSHHIDSRHSLYNKIETTCSGL